MWKIFQKAGEAGWKSLIPIYNGYIYFKIAGIPNLYWVILIISVLAALQNQFITILALIGIIVITIYHAYKLSKAFNHGIGYTIGLLFLNTIFLLIIGFSSDKYNLEK